MPFSGATLHFPKTMQPGIALPLKSVPGPAQQMSQSANVILCGTLRLNRDGGNMREEVGLQQYGTVAERCERA